MFVHFASSSARLRRQRKRVKQPPPLFEVRRVRKAGKGRAVAKRRRILLPQRKSLRICERYGLRRDGLRLTFDYRAMDNQFSAPNDFAVDYQLRSRD